MKTEPPIEGSTLQLAFKSHPKHDEQPVRACMAEGSLWFAARDICDIMHLKYEVVIPPFDATAPDTAIAPFEFATGFELVLSPIGVLNLCTRNESALTIKVASWARRKAAELLSEPPADDARLRLTINPDGSRPDYPNRFTGYRDQWKELLFHPLYKSPRQIISEEHIAEMRAIAAKHMIGATAPGADFLPHAAQ